MDRIQYIGIVLMGIIPIFLSFRSFDVSFQMSTEHVSSMSVSDVLVELGDANLIHAQEKVDPELAKIGLELLTVGKASYQGQKGKRISTYFQCTDCHSLKQETPRLTDMDPQLRLEYAVENQLPFYAGSTLHGIYNRISFYNDDYYQKYGELVNDAKDTLSNAIQLCAEYCASGRPLEEWELNAMLHYFKQEELTIRDLDLAQEELDQLQLALSKGGEQLETISWLKTKYPQKFAANFTGAMPESERLYGEKGNPRNGENIYEASCMFCHANSRVTYLDLGKDVLSGKFLWNNRKGYDDHSIYQVIRWGTYPITGRKQYMPLYTREKMSDEQLEDLMAYIKELANK